jgi:hypothetical protein
MLRVSEQNSTIDQLILASDSISSTQALSITFEEINPLFKATREKHLDIY